MTEQAVEHVDVVIVGAGISGIGAGCHLRRESPDRSFVILEARDGIGGTWDLFRYPGVRSDSDMHTLGYDFKPWTAEKAIADGASIMSYLRETVVENGLAPRIRFGHKVVRAEWSSTDARWTITASNADGETTLTAGFLFMCSGYYRYSAGYDAKLPNTERFGGTLVHPQFWPEDLDVDDKRVVVVGSGATAMTLIPALAEQGATVTMLQRSPTYVVARPDVDKIANRLRKVLPDKTAYAITRWKNVALGQLIYKRSRTQPAKMKASLLKGTRKHLGPDYDVDTHFTPSYDPWDQRLCLVPNADLFEAIKSGKASVVTDTIDTFTEHGIRLASGQELEADIVVTATGLQLVTLGEAQIIVDGEPVDFSQAFSYKGFMYSGVPNLASSFGYINASWTLRADLICRYVCRLLNHLRDTGTTICTPTLRASEAGMRPSPWIESFSSGYIQRDMDKLPKQGDREPWINPQNYTRDRKMFLKSPIDDGVMIFSDAKVPAAI
ncbi:MAG: NAD(P)/FAD-dependent oxidoreductase [Ilumatobacteraceae bacterium]